VGRERISFFRANRAGMIKIQRSSLSSKATDFSRPSPETIKKLVWLA
jgi:hypothetical protein